MTEEKSIYKENGFYNVNDIMAILECKKSKAYNVIKKFNEEREKKNLLAITGKIPAREFNSKFLSYFFLFLHW